jgi:predicted alpha/beta hydrolase family esterase
MRVLFQYHEQDMRYMITLPGIGGSGEGHWQSLWEKAEPRFTRFQPTSWDAPELNYWIQSVERAINGCKRPPVLVAHSLACLLVAHWAMRSCSRVAGAFLVSVPDPDGPKFPSAAASFRPIPDRPLPFPSLIVASTDDPYGTLAHVRLRSAQWQTGLVVAGALGHINASSGLGDWAQGRALLEAFCAGLPRSD